MDFGKNVMRVSFVLILFVFTSVMSGQIEVLQPGGILNQSEYDTLSWRTLNEPTVNFWNQPSGVGDSIAVWFNPEGPCSLIAIRVYAYDWEGDCLGNVWDGSRYDGHITTTDSTDTNGWIGKDLNGEWISGNVLGHSPIGGEIHGTGHIWGPFPFVITENLTGQWLEIPARYGLQGEVDLGDKPFFISVTLYQTAGHGWAAEDEGTVPFHSFYYYAEHDYGYPGPDGHFGWFIHSSSIWFEAIVKYTRTTSVEEDVDLKTPDTFILFQNYPNPFNPETTIEYTLPEPSRVRVEVYNLLGQVLEVLVDCEKNAGYHVIKWDASAMPSGVYFFRITAGRFAASKRMVLMK